MRYQLRVAPWKEKKCPLCLIYYTTPVELGCSKCKRLISEAKESVKKRVNKRLKAA